MRIYTSSSTEQPQEWDKTSSPEVVYHNKNIEVVPATDDDPVMYRYDVDEYTKDEYMHLQDDRIVALEEQNATLQLETLTALEAIAELYEAQML